MNADMQSWATIVIVVIATLWLTLRSVRKGGHGSCGSCGCDAKLKVKK